MDHCTLADSTASDAVAHCAGNFGGPYCDGSRGCGISEHSAETAASSIGRADASSHETLANALHGGRQGLATHAVTAESGAGLAASKNLVGGRGEQQVAPLGHLGECQAQIGVKQIRATLPLARNRKADALEVHLVPLISTSATPPVDKITGTAPAAAVPEGPLAPSRGDQRAGPSGQLTQPPDRRPRAEASAVHPPRHASQAVALRPPARGELHRPPKGRPAIAGAEPNC